MKSINFLTLALLLLSSAVLADPTLAAQRAIAESAVTEGALISALGRGGVGPAANDTTPATRAVDPDVGPSRSIQVSPRFTEPKPPVEAAQRSAPILLTFETNSAALTASAKRALVVVSRAFNSDTLKLETFIIEGHADPRGNPQRNLQLSQDRAEAVRAFLVVVGEIDVSRLKTVGRGDREPLNANDPTSPENRRVTFVTLPVGTDGR